jgi:hypothetical protein
MTTVFRQMQSLPVQFAVRAYVEKDDRTILLPEYRPIIAADVDAPAIRKYPVHGMIIEKRVKRFLQKDILSFDKLQADFLRYFFVVFEKRPMQCDFHTRLLQ